VVITQEVDAGPNYLVYSADRWETAMTKTIAQFEIPASHVIVLGNIPEFTGQGPQCLDRHPDNVQACSGPITPYSAVHNIAEQQAAARTGARYINVVPWFCSSTCTDVVGRYEPYWDAHHIDADYSFALFPVLNQALDLGAYAPSG